MTFVNVTNQENTVKVTDSSGSTIVQVPSTTVVTASTAGPQGAAGTGLDLDSSAKINGSVIYYDSASGKFLADETWTTSTLVIGGNF